MNLDKARSQINGINDEMLKLFLENGTIFSCSQGQGPNGQGHL